MVTQHRILVGGMKYLQLNKKTFTPKLRTWKLKDQDIVRKFRDKLNNLLEGDPNLILESV